MQVLIVEDETAAATNLQKMLSEIDSSLRVVDVIDTVTDTIQWLKLNPRPDIIFMDIHLADGSAFKIFEQIEIHSPIIFTTAYDRYALDAFRVTSIDYILKPIKTADLKRALAKFHTLSTLDVKKYVERVQQAAIKAQTFLIPVRDKLVPLSIEQIAYCYTSNEKVTAYTIDKKEFPLDKTLDALIEIFPEADFFRANRQFIISREAIRDLSVWFGSRLCVNLHVETQERIIISKARVAEFKRWFMSGN